MISNEEGSFRQIRTKHQLFEILRIMALPLFNGRVHDRILCDCLDSVALGGSREQIRTSLNRLEDLGLIRCSTVEDYVVAEMTEKGERIALGKDQIDEVARPPLRQS